MHTRSAQLQYIDCEDYYLLYLSETQNVWYGVRPFGFPYNVLILAERTTDKVGDSFQIFNTRYTGCSHEPTEKIGYIFFPRSIIDDGSFERYLQKIWEGGTNDNLDISEVMPENPNCVCMNLTIYTALFHRIEEDREKMCSTAIHLGMEYNYLPNVVGATAP